MIQAEILVKKTLIKKKLKLYLISIYKNITNSYIKTYLLRIHIYIEFGF